jgi:hypothetical protein
MKRIVSQARSGKSTTGRHTLCGFQSLVSFQPPSQPPSPGPATQTLLHVRESLLRWHHLRPLSLKVVIAGPSCGLQDNEPTITEPGEARCDALGRQSEGRCQLLALRRRLGLWEVWSAIEGQGGQAGGLLQTARPPKRANCIDFQAQFQMERTGMGQRTEFWPRMSVTLIRDIQEGPAGLAVNSIRIVAL